MNIKIIITFLLMVVMLCGCVSIDCIGELGPKKLGVYSISKTDFLSASRMLVILDKKGNVTAFSGGAVSGPGTVGLQAAGQAATAGAMIYGGRAIQNGLENVHAQINGIPSQYDINANINANGNFHSD